MSDDRKQLETLRASLEKKPSELEIADLVPVFVPSSFFELGNWPGPFDVLGVEGLGLAWAMLQPDQTMRYVDREVERQWDMHAIQWRDRALENLQRHSVRTVWTHEFRSDNGSLFAVAMMHQDGVGPSRLLLRESLERLFPEGYLVALPEMSCGIVLSAQATLAERAKIEELVNGCFTDGTRPLVAGLHVPSKLAAKPSM